MGLAINPDGDVNGPKLSEMVANGEIKQKSEDEETDKMRILCFKIDTTYTRTIPGFLRLVQIVSFYFFTTNLYFYYFYEVFLFSLKNH